MKQCSEYYQVPPATSIRPLAHATRLPCSPLRQQAIHRLCRRSRHGGPAPFRLRLARRRRARSTGPAGPCPIAPSDRTRRTEKCRGPRRWTRRGGWSRQAALAGGPLQRVIARVELAGSQDHLDVVRVAVVIAVEIAFGPVTGRPLLYLPVARICWMLSALTCLSGTTARWRALSARRWPPGRFPCWPRSSFSSWSQTG